MTFQIDFFLNVTYLFRGKKCKHHLLLLCCAATNDDEVNDTHLALFTAYYIECRKTDTGRMRMKVANRRTD